MQAAGTRKGNSNWLTLNLRNKTFCWILIALWGPSSFLRLFKTFKMIYGDSASISTHSLWFCHTIINDIIADTWLLTFWKYGVMICWLSKGQLNCFPQISHFLHYSSFCRKCRISCQSFISSPSHMSFLAHLLLKYSVGQVTHKHQWKAPFLPCCMLLASVGSFPS